MVDRRGDVTLRAENVSSVVTGFALRSYVFKDLVQVQSSSAWKESYFQETAADLTAQGINSVQGIPRLAEFPENHVTFTEQSSRHLKHGLRDFISIEDVMTNDINVMRETLMRISRAVVKSVDTNIWNTLTENQSATNINAVTSTAAWDAGSGQDPIEDIAEAIQLIEENDYEVVGKGVLVLSPKDFKSLLVWLISTKGANIPQFSSEKLSNGRVGEFLGLQVRVSNNVTADYAAVMIPKRCGVWKSAASLRTVTTEHPGISWEILTYEIGTCQLTNPKTVSLISNTQA